MQGRVRWSAGRWSGMYKRRQVDSGQAWHVKQVRCRCAQQVHGLWPAGSRLGLVGVKENQAMKSCTCPSCKEKRRKAVRPVGVWACCAGPGQQLLRLVRWPVLDLGSDLKIGP